MESVFRRQQQTSRHTIVGGSAILTREGECQVEQYGRDGICEPFVSAIRVDLPRKLLEQHSATERGRSARRTAKGGKGESRSGTPRQRGRESGERGIGTSDIERELREVEQHLRFRLAIAPRVPVCGPCEDEGRAEVSTLGGDRHATMLCDAQHVRRPGALRLAGSRLEVARRQGEVAAEL